MNLREKALERAVSNCPFVDTCLRHCTKKDQEICYGIIVDDILKQAIQEVLDILKAEGWVGVVYDRIAKLKEGK